MRSSRTLTPAVLAIAALLAACSVSKDEDSTATTTAETASTSVDSTLAPETTGAETTQPATLSRGVTADSIKIGGAFIDVDAVREQFGVELGNTPPEMIPAMIAGMNADGGINGRKVEYIERLVVPVGTESSDQACRELIEDEQVFAVVGTFLGDTGLCVTETNATPYFGGFGLTPERQQRSKAPFLTTALNEADLVGESVQYLLDNGLLEGKKVAVYSEAAGYSTDFVDTYVVSKLESANVEVVANTQLTDTGGDQVAAGAELDRILQSFQAAGADTVIVAGGMITFGPALERTEFAPQLYIINGQILAPDAVSGFGMTNPDELIGAVGLTEGSLSSELLDDPVLAECIGWINDNSDLAVTPNDILTVDEAPESRDFRNLPALCSIFQLLRATLTAAGDNPSADSISAGLDSLSSFALVGSPEASLSAERWGAGAPIRPWTYNAEQVRFLPGS